MGILLPKLKRVKLIGYYPIFQQTIEFNIDNNLYLILGGNGLGKTTILQSIIYCLAGPANENIESKENKSKRWGRDYFKDRLDKSENATIEVDFLLGNDLIKLGRGFTSDAISAFYLNNKLVTSDKKETDDFFEQYLDSEAGYESINDFNFIVHKLCYLSEKRENLAWDLDSQTRILMQILTDTISEETFRKRRSELKELDSKIRHNTVDINKVKSRIERINNQDEILQSAEPKVEKTSIDVIDVEKLQKDLITNSNEHTIKKRELSQIKQNHQNIIREIDELREKVSSYERAFFFEQLNQLESNEAKLAIHKLIHYKLCPSCGSSSEELYLRAINYIKEHSCPLCGNEEETLTNQLTPGLEADLSEKLKAKLEIEKALIKFENELEELEERISDLNSKANSYLLNRKSDVIILDKITETPNQEDQSKLEKALSNLISLENELKIQYSKLQQKLEDDYDSFSSQNASRINDLASLYEKYASEFLSIKCSLVPIKSSDKFLDLNLLVPEFNARIRSTPDSCSEAQRFFLDIAFRMALIELAGGLSNFAGGFICETPESALDITYMNNVADMIDLFAIKRKYSLLMTSNIQSKGIARSLLSRIKKEQRHSYLLNMLEVAVLSEVQSSDEGKRLFEEELKEILEGTYDNK